MSKSRRQQGAAANKGLRAIRLKGFKCFRDETSVEIRPLTLLAGANSGGKSSLMQPLLMLKQTLEAPFDAAPLLLDGPLFRVEHAATLAWKGKARSDVARSWSVELEGDAFWVRNTYGMGGRAGIRLDSTAFLQGGLRVHERMSEAEFAEFAQRMGLAGLLGGIPKTRSQVFFQPSFSVEFLTKEQTLKALVSLRTSLAVPDDTLLDLIHLPGLRGNPERAYRLTRAAERFPGPFQAYVASLLLAWKEAGDPRLLAVGQDLRALGLSWKVDPRQRGDTAVEVQIGRLPAPQKGGAQDLVNIADVGFGASQVLPVVVALQAAKAGQIVHIEQPELHLHPRAQVSMADLLLNAAKRGARVVVETHSGVLLRAVQRRVAEGAARPDMVALHWFQRGEEGASHVRTAHLDSQGAYGDWPVDFAEVEMEVEQAYIDAAFKQG